MAGSSPGRLASTSEGAAPCRAVGACTVRCARQSGRILRSRMSQVSSASTTLGSNWVPAWAMSSARASYSGIRRR